MATKPDGRAKPKILVVDDDPAVRKMLSLLFEASCEVLLASTGEEGLRLVAAQRPRLMLLDVVMPGIGGLEVLKAARAILPALTVIMLTGQTDMDLARKALDLGAVEFVTKPFEMASLKDKIGRSLETLPAGGRDDHGLPWRVVEPEAPAAAAGGAGAPSQEALARWEGEGGETDLVEKKA